MKIYPDELRFIWDPDADRKKSVRSSRKNREDAVRSFEDYFDFIDQFNNSSGKKRTDQHVDKQFSLY